MAHADSLDEFWNIARGSEEVFDPVQVASLPEPARRYVNHAIAPGTPLARAVRLRMHGQIKLKKWASFTAEEVIRWDRGMVWEATVKLYGLTISGFDRLVDGHGEMQWRLLVSSRSSELAALMSPVRRQGDLRLKRYGCHRHLFRAMCGGVISVLRARAQG